MGLTESCSIGKRAIPTRNLADPRRSPCFVASPISTWPCSPLPLRNSRLSRSTIIGPFRNLPTAHNIVAHGEMRMEDTVGYIKFADIGLDTIVWRPHSGVLSDSLKLRQYTYCRLPIVGPNSLMLETNRMYLLTTERHQDHSVRLLSALPLSIDREFEAERIQSSGFLRRRVWTAAKIRTSHDGVSVKCWVSFFSLFLLWSREGGDPCCRISAPWMNRLSRAVH